MFFPYPYILEDLEEGIPLIKINKKVRCDGCGRYMKLDDAYLVIEYTYLRCHMKEQCITTAYEKAKARREEFELALLGAIDYGKI